jgi:hypothetical protein
MTYQQRKKAGMCVRKGCKRKPRMNGKKRRSYCKLHTDQNQKNANAYLKRKAKKAKLRKAKAKARRLVERAPAMFDRT